MRSFLRCAGFVFVAACGGFDSIDPTGREQVEVGADSPDLASGYSRSATPSELPVGFPFAPPIGPDEVGGSGEAEAPPSLCDDGGVSKWEPRCGAEACGPCSGEAACLPATLPEERLQIRAELALQLQRAPERLVSFWTNILRNGRSKQVYFEIRRETAMDTKLSFDVYEQLPSATGEVLPAGSGPVVLYERWIGGNADGSLLREALSQQAMAVLTGQPVESGEHRLVKVNGTTYGPMFIVRVLDDATIEAAGRSTDALRYAPGGTGDTFASGGSALVPLPGGLYAEAFSEVSPSADEFTPLAALVESAVAVDAAEQAGGSGAGACAVRRVLDVNGYLDGLAALALLGDAGHARSNYLLSLQPSVDGGRRWEVWYDSFGLSFGCVWNEVENNARCGAMDARTSPYACMYEGDAGMASYPVTQYFNLLTDVVLRDPELERAFRARICDMLDSAYWKEALPRQIESLGALLGQSASSDTANGVEGYRSEVAALTAYHAERTRLLRSQFLCF